MGKACPYCKRGDMLVLQAPRATQNTLDGDSLHIWAKRKIPYCRRCRMDILDELLNESI